MTTAAGRPATLGLDVGTSATKGVVLAVDGTVLASASADYPLLTPRPGWSEQAPEDWWAACREVCRELVAATDAEILGVGLSGQMHGSVFLDRQGEVIRPALLWNDARTGAECAEIERRLGRERVVAITGNRASAGFQAPKILWLERHEPDAHHRIAHVLLPKDFVRFRLTGDLASDAADASGTLLLDLRTRRYSEEMMAALGVPRQWLPDVFESPEVTGRVSAAGAAATALPEGVPVVAGGGDNACAAIGAGVIDEGSGICSIGTSGTICLHSAAPRIDPEGALNAFCDAVPGGWHLMGVILSAGGCLRWFQDALAPNEAGGFEALLQAAAEVPPGAEGLLFLPYLAGERSPHMDPDARGGWLGLSLAHDRRHMVRALVEGVGFAFRDCLERMRGLGLEPPELTLVGGGAQSPAWRLLLAAQLDLPLLGAASGEGPALGAAILAATGAGLHPDLAAAVRASLPAAGAPERPDAELALTYRRLHARWGRLYPALKAAGLFAPA
ncbi:MAG TPA: xylulokinase [Geminicoccaceae bacterium]|nr:xylulokinase [Geminicoccaceae bacterium]